VELSRKPVLALQFQRWLESKRGVDELIVRELDS
jgi:hypothetical protein